MKTIGLDWYWRDRFVFCGMVGVAMLVLLPPRLSYAAHPFFYFIERVYWMFLWVCSWWFIIASFQGKLTYPSFLEKLNKERQEFNPEA